MAPELDLLTFPIPGLVGAMAQMFEGAGWDGLYLAIAAVQAASGGRAVLGIGRGDSSLGYLGRRPAPVADFEIYLARVRGFLHGETVDLGDATSHNQWITETAQPPVPIDVAATGPKVTAIAARHADRVTFAVGADPARLRDAISLVRSQREDAGLDPAGISVGA
jgi:5,10-methylenetetrahydromethanopterin reductase